jgi:O-antigen/teichoic acid export membrane protein
MEALGEISTRGISAFTDSTGGKMSGQPNPSGRFAIGAGLLVSGTAAGQAIVILSAPLLTRLYSPGEFGALGVYVGVLAFITLVASFRYEVAIPLPRSENSARALLIVALVVTVGVAGLTGVLVAFFGHKLAARTNMAVLEPYLWLLPIGVLVGGGQKALLYWALRRRAFGHIARVRMQQGGGIAGFQALFGLLHLGAGGLVAGHLLGVASGFAGLARYAWKGDKAEFLRIRLRKMWHSARRYRRFPLYSTWSDMANVAGTQIPLILLASMFSPLIAGLYMLAHRVANAPAALVAEAIGKVFMAGAATARNDGTLPELCLRVFQLLLRLGVGPLLIVALVAPEFFQLVFGAGWKEGGFYLRLMVPWLSAVFIFAPLSTLYGVLERQPMDLTFQITLLVSRMSALVAGAALAGPIVAIGLYSITAAAVYIGFGTALLHEAGVSYRDLMRTALGELAVVTPLGVVLFVAKRLLPMREPSFSDPATLAVLAFAGTLAIIPIVRVRHAVRRLRHIA